MMMAARIRRARRKVALSQSVLAEQLQIRRSAVSNWECGSGIQPSLQNLIALAKVCEVSFEWLATGRGTMAPDEGLWDDTPTADAELVEAHEERELLAMFRTLPRKSQQLVVVLLETLQVNRRRTARAGMGFRAKPRPESLVD